MNPGPAVRETFSRHDRLRKRRDFEECYASGVRVSGRHVQLFLLPGGETLRLGLSVSRRVGPAPARNRVKRRLREIFRRSRAALGEGGGRLAVNARPSAAAASFDELSRDFLSAVARARSAAPR